MKGCFQLDNTHTQPQRDICTSRADSSQLKTIIVHAFVESNCWFMQKRKEIQFRRLHSRVYFVTGLASVENNIYFRFWPLWEFYNTTFVSFFLLILGFRHLQPLQKLYLTFHHIYLFLFCFIKWACLFGFTLFLADIETVS